MKTKTAVLGDFDLRQLNSPDFKEDSVREVIILPILKQLGYENKDIVRSKSLQHPFLKIGSKKREVKLVPDYLLKIEDNYAWVLDAKSPGENIKSGENVEQIYSYAIHPEIRTKYFALCNGREFVLYRQDIEKPIVYFEMCDIDRYWEDLEKYLSPNSFQVGKKITFKTVGEKSTEYKTSEFDYLNRPLLDEISVKKQAAARHFGVNAYFTRQSWDIVNAYIRNFSKPDDLVFDPFGGSGVTVIEAMMLDRKAIHVDLNPLSVFLAKSLAAPVKTNEFVDAFNRVRDEYLKHCPTNKVEITKALKKYPSPKGYKLPKGSDVDTVEKLFTEKQRAELALLKHLILLEKKENIKISLLLAFYNTISIINLTFHETPHGGGNHFGYYYRYRIAPKPAHKDTFHVFESKFKRILNAKKDIQFKINESTIDRLKIVKGTATNVKWLKNESVDYIYTDPPYGAKIPYLDLSIIWNTWLDLDVTEKDYKDEAIEGGEHNKTKAEYGGLISKSIEEMYRVLKYDRWMSFVFAHKDPEFWHLIVETAERAGFEYAGAVKQSNGQTTFKKRQNPFTVLSGQLIINFKKVPKPRSIMKANLGMDISNIVLQTIEGIIAKHSGASLEQINDELIIKGLELGFLDLLKKEYSDLTPILMDTFDFDEESHIFKLKQNTKFKTQIDINLRIKYYLISYLRRQELEGKLPSFDEIVLNIMPLLKNGTTPEDQTILNVLKIIAEHVGQDRWQLKKESQTTLFI